MSFGDMSGGDRAITIQDVIFRFYLDYFRLMSDLKFINDAIMFARGAQNAYFMVDSLYSMVQYYMEPEDVKRYKDLGDIFKEKFKKIQEQKKENYLLSGSDERINNLYLRLSNSRLKIISASLGKKGILKEHSGSAMIGEHAIRVDGQGRVMDDGDDETAVDSLD